MLPVVPPQVPSVETLVAVTTGPDEVEDATDVVAVLTAELEEVKTEPLELRYQLVEGSPRHSPTVTALKPLAWSCWSMYSVKL